jgi:hypothetical protein
VTKEDAENDGAQSDEQLDLTAEEREDLVEAETAATAITYTAQDFDIVGLVRRFDSNDILIPSFGHDDSRIVSAGFQRSFVWNRPQMDRFIESLLLGYPIPGIFLVRQADRRYLVLDGQQRLRTLAYFYKGLFDGREFSLRNVADAFKGLTYATLSDDQRRLLDDTFFQATIVATDGSSGSLDSVYQIFERLNSGGTPLTPHEIRVALFAGEFIDYLEDLNRVPEWRDLYGKVSPRLRDQELVLRIVAFYLHASDYRRPLKTFLNRIVAINRDVSQLPVDVVTRHFTEAATLLGGVGKQVLRLQGRQVTAALAEALFVGLMRRLDIGDVTVEQVRVATNDLLANRELISAASTSTADEESVRTRMQIATDRFAEV